MKSPHKKTTLKMNPHKHIVSKSLIASASPANSRTCRFHFKNIKIHKYNLLRIRNFG